MLSSWFRWKLVSLVSSLAFTFNSGSLASQNLTPLLKSLCVYDWVLCYKHYFQECGGGIWVTEWKLLMVLFVMCTTKSKLQVLFPLHVIYGANFYKFYSHPSTWNLLKTSPIINPYPCSQHTDQAKVNLVPSQINMKNISLFIQITKEEDMLDLPLIHN